MVDEAKGSILNQQNPKTVRIILVDDHPLFRRALRAILETQGDFEVIAEASDGLESVELATKLIPDVIVMDISMPRLNGLEATRQIKDKCPEITILVLTIHDDNEHIMGILQAGAAGYLTKSIFGNELIPAIRAMITGEAVLSQSILQQILKQTFQYTLKSSTLTPNKKLSSRDLEILVMVARGDSNKEIAAKLNLTERTVKSYLADLFLKLNVGSRTEAVIVALQTGIITLDALE